MTGHEALFRCSSSLIRRLFFLVVAQMTVVQMAVELMVFPVDAYACIFKKIYQVPAVSAHSHYCVSLDFRRMYIAPHIMGPKHHLA